MTHKRFSNAAATYNRHAAPQLELVEELLQWAPQKPLARILDVGAGTGLLTTKLADHYPTAPIDAIDIAEEMVEQSRQQFSENQRIQWHLADAQTYQPTHPYDLIASSAALHWSPDLTATLQNLHTHLQPGGIFLLGLMLRGTLWELRAIRRRIAPTKGPGLSLPTESSITEQINATGFNLLEVKTHERRHIYPTGRAFLQAIHEQGVTALPQADLPLNRTELKALIHTYETQHATAGGVYATYETACFHLQKKESPTP
jgi:malonyl-CoA O-methyltransferase